ncbi:hypothetical protein GOP47_0008887 [Adiantum capillus-veneris]|uniref:Uncharacterized protein n=1 Tax=Adiantum capillus-veneris TaxID=13818 RepID=A0A9D4ZK53_ADICA|nr:hypothetical protein GOP47_0008887 [Adiantum capillus-veneris]
MENWHLFTAAFILSVVDLSVLGAFLWYQLSTLYFAWHLCPMIVNRICELIAFMFTGGMLPSLFAFVQVLLSLFSTTIYANRQQHLQNKLLLAVYCTLLLYESLVALLLVKMGRYLKRPVSVGLQQSRSSPGQPAPQPYIAFHMFALFTQPLGPGCQYAISHDERLQDSQVDGFVTVQQPDGKKVMLGRVLQSKFELPVKEEEPGDTKEGSQSKDNDDVRVTITSSSVPSEMEHGSNVCSSQASGLPGQVNSIEHIPSLPSSKSGQVNSVDGTSGLPAQMSPSELILTLPSSTSGHVSQDGTSTSQSTISPKGTEHCDIEMPVLQSHGESIGCS